MVSQAVIAAAGRGTRFLPATKVAPKELLPLFDRPVIQHLIEEIAAAGIPEVIIVTRPDTEAALRRYFSPDPDLDRFLATQGKSHLLQTLYDLLRQVRLTFVQQDPELPYGSASPLLAVQDLVSFPFVYFYGDDVILDQEPGHSLRELLALYRREEPAAVVGVSRVSPQEISALGSVAYHAQTDCQAAYLVEKPEPEAAPSMVTPIGRQILSSAIFLVLAEMRNCLAAGQELQMTSALSSLAGTARVLAPEIRGRWLTTGDPLSLLQASLAFARHASTV